MMRRRRARQLEEAAEIRRVQRGQAELNAVAAQTLVEERTKARALCGKRLSQYQTGWRAALADAPSSDVSRAWSAAIVRQLSELSTTDADLSQAHDNRATCYRDWASASIRHRLVTERARDAGQAITKHMEEAQLREISERFAARRHVR